ncbi:MAG: DegQ family serine endoprotease [Gammaproteobacteria bacterium]|nr:DegQ family serine endoprotease [Gammaproteobacteria bacterium]
MRGVAVGRGRRLARVLLTLALAWGATSVPAALPPMVEGERLPSLAPMLERVTPAVVNISTRSTVRAQRSPLLSDPFFRRFFDVPDRPQERRSQSLGSGVVVDARRGYVLTNHHVVDNAQEIAVTLQDGRRLEGKLVGSDPETDIAVVQVPPENLTALNLADSDRLRVGDFVVAIGNPFGLGQTVTSGIVSALGRRGLGIEGYEDFIQTDASINPGNSGGPLVDLRGELVGLNTAILAPNGGNVGIGFAIPANMARDVMAHLVAHGAVRRGEIGVTVQDLTPALAGAFDLSREQGAVVTGVAKDSPAARAGLKPGDALVSINGREVRDAADVRNAIGLLRVGQEVRVEFQRAGKVRSVTIRVAEPSREAAAGDALHPHLAGATFGDLESPQQGRKKGVGVLGVEGRSPAAELGLRKGDVITSVNRTPVEGLEDFTRLVRQSGSGLLLGMRRGATSVYILVR